MENSRGGLTPEQFILLAKYISYGDKFLEIEISTATSMLETNKRSLIEYTGYLQSRPSLVDKVSKLNIKKKDLEGRIELMRLCIGSKK